MRYLLSVIILLTTFCSCTRQTNPPKDISQTWSEAQKRKYFEDSIAFRMYNGNSHYSVNGKQIVPDNSLNDFEDFIDSLYPEIKAVNKHLPFIYAFEEPYIDTSHIETSKKWFRMILDPCWRIPVCITLEKRNHRCYLTSKMTNGQGGYYSGVLITSYTRVFPDTLYNNVRAQLQTCRFNELGEEPDNCYDGTTWHFEFIDQGKYHYVMRRCLEKGERKQDRAILCDIAIKLLAMGKYSSETYDDSWPYISKENLKFFHIDSNDFKVKIIDPFFQ